jgi:hypothetical protein
MLAQLQQSKQYFETGATKSFVFRKQQLQLLAATIKKYEAENYNSYSMLGPF